MDDTTVRRKAEETQREGKIRRVPFGTCRLESEGWAATVYYDILVETIQKRGALYCEDYGARIELIPESGPSEVAELPGITPFLHVIELFMERLRQGGVTPATAGDVLEDYLAE